MSTDPADDLEKAVHDLHNTLQLDILVEPRDDADGYVWHATLRREDFLDGLKMQFREGYAKTAPEAFRDAANAFNKAKPTFWSRLERWIRR